MTASVNDKLRRGAPAFSTTLAADKGAGAPSATLSSATTVPTDTGVDFTVGRVDSNGNKTPAKKAVYKATLSGSTISNLTLVEGTDQLHGAGTPVEITFTAATWNDMVTWGLTQHNQDGSHAAITSTSITNTGPLTTTGPTVLNGSWDGWIGANETWAYASATTITVPTDATIKYDVGDYIKLTQTTAKYFVVTGVASTLLTVSGLAGATVANAAITANSYSKARNPHNTGLNGAVPYKPYKFSVWRSAAASTGNGSYSIITFDTKEYDTSSNYSTATGMFTAPIAGWYRFSWNASINGNGALNLTALHKNAAEYKDGSRLQPNTTSFGSGGAVEMQLAATDTVDIRGYGSTAANGYVVGQAQTWFMGSIISAL